jgi:hypothetical protein
MAGIFGKIFGAAKKKLFGSGVAETSAQKHFRSEEEAAYAASQQTGARRRLLERRVAEGKSAKVYKNRKNVDLLSTRIAGSGESPFWEDFLDGFPFGRFASSNVWRIQYDRTQETLYVQYMGGRGKKRGGPGHWYQYKQVPEIEARSLYNTASKGVWSWSYLRIRGTQTGNKKPTAKDVAPPHYLPLGRKKSNILQSP